MRNSHNEPLMERTTSMNLTLDETWEECIKMWRWIVANRRPGDNIHTSKRAYADKLYPEGEMPCNCFFCDYAEANEKTRSICLSCPGVLVDPSFVCDHPHYAYNGTRPELFLAKLEELNRIRLSKKEHQDGTST